MKSATQSYWLASTTTLSQIAPRRAKDSSKISKKTLNLQLGDIFQ